MKKALITGINGQDASYLAEFLLSKNYEVHATTRRNSVLENQHPRVEHIKNDIRIYQGDISDTVSMINLLQQIQPDEIYNLAAQSDVKISFQNPAFTTHVNAVSVANLLESTRLICPQAKFYQASSSEMFGNSKDADGFQRESTPMLPVSPYGIAKLFAHNTGVYYRKRFGMFVCNGILFNHESPRRGTNFVTNKVVKNAVMIKAGLADSLILGNLESRRDWGHSSDYVKAMWHMMQHNEPDDFVCASGISHSVKDMVSYVFGQLDLDWTQFIKQDAMYFRDPELYYLKGDSTKLLSKTNYTPQYTFETMLDEMIAYWKTQLL